MSDDGKRSMCPAHPDNALAPDCEACGGWGKRGGDGRDAIRCTECSGTGKAKRDPALVEKARELTERIMSKARRAEAGKRAGILDGDGEIVEIVSPRDALLRVVESHGFDLASATRDVVCTGESFVMILPNDTPEEKRAEVEHDCNAVMPEGLRVFVQRRGGGQGASVTATPLSPGVIPTQSASPPERVLLDAAHGARCEREAYRPGGGVPVALVDPIDGGTIHGERGPVCEPTELRDVEVTSVSMVESGGHPFKIVGNDERGELPDDDDCASQCVEVIAAEALGDEWREAIEAALGVEPDPGEHTPQWAREIVLAHREIGNKQPDAQPPKLNKRECAAVLMACDRGSQHCSECPALGCGDNTATREREPGDHLQDMRQRLTLDTHESGGTVPPRPSVPVAPVATRESFVCPECGPGAKADDEHCCAACGADCAVVAMHEPTESEREQGIVKADVSMPRPYGGALDDPAVREQVRAAIKARLAPADSVCPWHGAIGSNLDSLLPKLDERKVLDLVIAKSDDDAVRAFLVKLRDRLDAAESQRCALARACPEHLARAAVEAASGVPFDPTRPARLVNVEPADKRTVIGMAATCGVTGDEKTKRTLSDMSEPELRERAAKSIRTATHGMTTDDVCGVVAAHGLTVRTCGDDPDNPGTLVVTVAEQENDPRIAECTEALSPMLPVTVAVKIRSHPPAPYR
jgi:ribosomal protein L34E